MSNRVPREELQASLTHGRVELHHRCVGVEGRICRLRNVVTVVLGVRHSEGNLLYPLSRGRIE